MKPALTLSPFGGSIHTFSASGRLDWRKALLTSIWVAFHLRRREKANARRIEEVWGVGAYVLP